MGAERRAAVLAGTAIVTLPCVLVFANVAYVDNLVLATYGVRLPGLPPAAAPRLVFPAAISFELAKPEYGPTAAARWRVHFDSYLRRRDSGVWRRGAIGERSRS